MRPLFVIRSGICDISRFIDVPLTIVCRYGATYFSKTDSSHQPRLAFLRPPPSTIISLLSDQPIPPLLSDLWPICPPSRPLCLRSVAVEPSDSHVLCSRPTSPVAVARTSPPSHSSRDCKDLFNVMLCSSHGLEFKLACQAQEKGQGRGTSSFRCAQRSPRHSIGFTHSLNYFLTSNSIKLCEVHLTA